MIDVKSLARDLYHVNAEYIDMINQRNEHNILGKHRVM